MLDLLIYDEALFALLILQLLDEVEHTLLIEFKLCTEEELGLRVLHRLKHNINVVFDSICDELEHKLVS